MDKRIAGWMLAALGAVCTISACSGEEEPLAPPPKGEGIQYRMVSMLPAGVETERCAFFTVPPEGLNITGQKVWFTRGSHHVLLYKTPYTAIPASDRFGRRVEPTEGQWFECGPAGPIAHWRVDGIVGGSQNHEGDSIMSDLPEGVALKVPGSTVLLMNTHYVNATSSSMTTDVRINIHTAPDGEVQHEAGVLFLYNRFIRLLPKSEGGAQVICPVHADIHLVKGESHMHRRGVHQKTVLRDSQGVPVETLYEGDRWQDVLPRTHAPPRAIKAGESIDFTCKYRNTEDRVVTQGPSAEDEMCMFIGLYYPRDRRTELCGLTETWAGATLGGQWVGQGTLDGAETAQCLVAAKPVSEDAGASFYGCVVDSCPGVSAPMSDAVRCLVTTPAAACEQPCRGGGAACEACVHRACQPALAALGASEC